MENERMEKWTPYVMEKKSPYVMEKWKIFWRL